MYDRYLAALTSYVDAAEPGSLLSLFPEAPVTERTNPVGQVTHWLFALGDTLAINAFRCLALLAVFDAERERARREVEDADLSSGSGVGGLSFVGACLHEAMRLWRATPMLSRETVRDTDWDGVPIRRTQLVIVNPFTHAIGRSLRLLTNSIQSSG